MQFEINILKLNMERVWREFGCRDALRFLCWKDQDGVLVNNTIHYKPKAIKVKGSLANRRRWLVSRFASARKIKKLRNSLR